MVTLSSVTLNNDDVKVSPELGKGVDIIIDSGTSYITMAHKDRNLFKQYL
tara:strand:- start:399 stop:548 length:150 start_codon:yes stop_codon:yes gene_type:complete